MNVQAIMNTGNDVDIVEISIRHNLKFLSKILVIDNNSTDGTLDILESLSNEFGSDKLVYIKSHSKTPSEHVIITNFFKEQVKLSDNPPDYLFFLDADELISAENLEELSTIPENHVGVVKWKCYIPNKLDHKNFHEEMQYRRDHEPDGCHKVVIPKSTNGFLTLGNHFIHQSDERCPHVELNSISLAHYPVRSIKQMFKKVEFISKFLKYEDPNQSYHLRKQLRLETLEDLIKLAVMYADKNKDTYELVYDPLK